MANYTITLKKLLDSGFQLDLASYPIFDENYRETLNNKIINHYNFHEIGFETPNLFRDRLACTLNEIMPYYNDLYKSKLSEFDPNTYHEIIKYSGSEVRTAQDTGTDTTTYVAAKKTGDTKNFEFDTPQNIASLNDDSEAHMSGATKSVSTQQGYTDENKFQHGHTLTDTLQFTNRQDERNGYNQSKYKTIAEYRSVLLNIDMMIIDELLDLFMLVY